MSKVRELYPSFRVADANDLIRSLNLSEPALLIELQRRKAEYQALDFGLQRWTETLTALDDPATDPQGLHRAQRRELADKLRKTWRREIRPVNIENLRTNALVLQLDGNDLPDADFMLGQRGFEHVGYLKITGNAFPPTGNAFLNKFTHLDSLKITCALNEVPTSITDMTQLRHLYLNNNNITLNEEARGRLGKLTQLRVLNLSNNPLGIPPDITDMFFLDTLLLRNTGIEQWPPGASVQELDNLHLQGNRITTVPDELFNTEWMELTNARTLLHDNPLSAETLQQIAAYRRRTGIALGGQLPGITHVARTPDDVGQWLAGVPSEQHARRKTLWAQLQRHEEASPEDTFRVLRDLTRAYAYSKNETSRQALTRRVWNLLDAMGRSTELRDRIYLSTYVAGTCGDGALLAFIDMEIQHLRYKAKSHPGSQDADRELLGLSKSLYYLQHLDQLAEAHLHELREAGIDPDDAEVKLYLRIEFAREFNLPVQREEMLYSVEAWVGPRDVASIRQKLLALDATQGPQNSLLTEDFWIDYLENSFPEPFFTVDQVTRVELDRLNRELPDKRSDAYLERRQSITDLEIAERNRVIRQLTEAAQLAQRAAQP